MVSVEEVRKELEKFSTLTEKLLFLRLISEELGEKELRSLEDELLQEEGERRRYEEVEVRGFTEENLRGEVRASEEVEVPTQQAPSQLVQYVPVEKVERSARISGMGPSIGIEVERGVEESEEDLIKRVMERDRFSLEFKGEMEGPRDLDRKFEEIPNMNDKLRVKREIKGYIQRAEEL